MTIQKSREALEMTQQDLAARAGVTQGQLAVIESGTPLVFSATLTEQVREALAGAEADAALRSAGWVEFDPRQTGA